MKQIFLICLVVMLAGLVVVVLPDGDERLISFSKSHGPSLIDTIGLCLIVGPWLFMAIHATLNWPGVLQLFGRRLVTALMAVAIFGLLLLVVGIRSDSNLWWIGAGLSAAAQFALIVPTFRRKRRRR